MTREYARETVMSRPFYSEWEDGSHVWEWIYDKFRFMISFDPNDEEGQWSWICVSQPECGKISEYGDIPDEMIELFRRQDV